MKLNKIVAVDNVGLVDEVVQELEKIAKQVVLHDDFPKSNAEIISRIKDADAVLVSWNTPIDKEVIQSCSQIRYIGMCCTLIDEDSANVDIRTANSKGIKVLGVRDYGDEGVIEFIISELVRLMQGNGEHQWQQEVSELTEQKLGIIGMGTLGKMLAEKAQSFGMEVYYYNRSRKKEVENTGVKYLKLDDLLKEADVVSTHLPRNTKVIDSAGFEKLGDNKILVNTSLEPTFDVSSFNSWVEKKGNYGIFDKAAMGKHYDVLKKHSNVIYTDKVVGWTKQAKKRLSYKALEI
ncbi:NAD(P)-dependent oxidoreductase [Proteinivorax hydrogeniformans]|uniref:NAD(P)-dependent oxidoreductase n=1 Tax=Proteinivorax hydrogeniformans TaxID=1826727 RepID=A0AAU8HTK8_9FIRM